MKKLTALTLAMLVLTGCGETPDPVEQFRESIKQSGTTLSGMQDADIDEMGVQLCEHYAGGFNTQDLADEGGDRLGVAGEAALGTICSAN